jgi:hypothetical protein
LGRRRGCLAGHRLESRLVGSSAAVTFAIVALSLAVPAVAHRLWTRPDPALLTTLAPGTTMLVSVDRAPAVLVSRSPRVGLRDVPWVSEWECSQLLALAELKKDAGVSQLDLPFALLAVYDHVTRRAYLMAGPVDLLRQSGFVSVEVAPLSSDGRIVRALRIIGPPQH